MDVVAARFPGVERCDMERIARWARHSPKSTLGAWPDAEHRQVLPEGERDQVARPEVRGRAGGRAQPEVPLCECAADVEAVYLTLLDHHVLEVVRGATPESFTDRVVRFHLHGAQGGGGAADPDPETLWFLQSESTDAEHWGAVWNQYRKANGAKTADAMALATKLRHRALATQRSASKESPTVDAPQPARSLRAAPPGKTGCVDADFCKLGASDLMKRVALDLRTMALSFNMEAIVHGRNHHPKHLLVVHRVLAAYEAEARTSLQATLAGAMYHPPIVSSLCWEDPEVSSQPSPSSMFAATQCESTAMLQEATPRAHRQWGSSPPVSPPADGHGTAFNVDTDAALAPVPSRERTGVPAKPDARKTQGGAEERRPSVSLTVKSATAAMAGLVQVRLSAVDGVTTAARARVKTPVLSFGPASVGPARVRAQPPRPATSDLTADVSEALQQLSVQRHRDHRWGARRKERQQRQERQTWVDKQSHRRTQQQIGMLTPTPTPSAQPSHQSSSSGRAKQLGGEIPAFRQDRSRWGVLRTQSNLARHQEFLAGDQRLIERSLSTSAIA